MKKVLLTGATGFVGLHTVRVLQSKGYEVHVLQRPASNVSKLEAMDKKVTVHHADLSDRAGVLAAVINAAPDFVFHLATSTLMSGKTADAKTLLATNVEGAVNLMDAAAEVGATAFVNMGSFSEYGPKDHPVKEDERCDPVELYAVSKLAATLYGQGLARRGKLACVTFRLFTPYGPGIQEGRLVRAVIEKTLRGEDIPLGKPTISRDFIYAADIAPLLIEAAENIDKHTGKIYNAGSGVRTSLAGLVESVEKLANVSAKPQWNAFPLLSYDSELWQADMAATFNAFAWRPATSLEEGLKSLIAYLG